MAIQFPSPVADGYSFTAENGVVYTFDSSGGGGWYAYHPDGLNDVYVNIDGDTMTGDLTVPSLNEGPLAGFRNRIINGQLSIWQRSSPVTLAGNGYGPDRWAKVGGSEVSLTRRPRCFGQIGGCEVSGTAIQNSKILQPIEIGWGGATGPFYGQWTLSWYSDAPPTSASAEFAKDSGSTDSVPWTADPAGIQSLGGERYSITFTATAPAANSEVVNVIFVPPTAATWLFSGVQFEPGPVATPVEIRPVGLELSLCERYFQTGWAYIRATPAGTRCGNRATFRTYMRGDPTVTTAMVNGFGNTEVVFDPHYDGFNVVCLPNANGEMKLTYTADTEL